MKESRAKSFASQSSRHHGWTRGEYHGCVDMKYKSEAQEVVHMIWRHVMFLCNIIRTLYIIRWYHVASCGIMWRRASSPSLSSSAAASLSSAPSGHQRQPGLDRHHRKHSWHHGKTNKYIARRWIYVYIYIYIHSMCTFYYIYVYSEFHQHYYQHHSKQQHDQWQPLHERLRILMTRKQRHRTMLKTCCTQYWSVNLQTGHNPWAFDESQILIESQIAIFWALQINLEKFH